MLGLVAHMAGWVRLAAPIFRRMALIPDLHGRFSHIEPAGDEFVERPLGKAMQKLRLTGREFPKLCVGRSI